MRADKILERMKTTQTDWGQRDFRSLYEGFGFKRTEKGGHTVYHHPDYPWILATVARHNRLAPMYARQAIEKSERLKQLQAEAAARAAEAAEENDDGAS